MTINSLRLAMTCVPGGGCADQEEAEEPGGVVAVQRQ